MRDSWAGFNFPFSPNKATTMRYVYSDHMHKSRKSCHSSGVGEARVLGELN